MITFRDKAGLEAYGSFAREFFHRRISMAFAHSINRWLAWRGIVSAAVLLLTVAPAFAQSNTEDIARSGIRKRFDRLRSVVAQYERIDIYTPERSLVEKIDSDSDRLERFVPIIGTRLHACTFRHLGGLSRFEQRLVKGASPYEQRNQIWSYFPDRVEAFWETHENRKIGDIRPNPTLPPNYLIDLALGLRLFSERMPLTQEELEQFQIDVSDANIVVLRASRWEGKPNSDIVHEWRFDQRFSYALVAYRRTVRGEVAEEFILGNFLDADGVLLPELIEYRRPHGARDTQTTVIWVESYKLDDVDNTRDSYSIDWPEGTVMVSR